MPYLQTTDIQTYYEDDPGPDAVGTHPLVLIHGFTGSLAQWAAARPMLAAERQVIAYDVRGHGQSDAPEDPERYSMAGYADDLRALLDGLDLARVHLLGSSFGGMIALEFALQYPERLHSLILADTSAGPRCVELSELIAQREDGIAQALQTARATGQVAVGERQPAISLHGFLGAGQARAERPDHHEDLHRLTMPVLVVVGDRDVLVPAAEYMDERLPQSQLRQINHAGHPAVRDQPHGFVAVVRGFLAGIEPGHDHRAGARGRE